MVAKLAALGAGVTWEQVAAIAGDSVVSRPHIARAMAAAGWARIADYQGRVPSAPPAMPTATGARPASGARRAIPSVPTIQRRYPS
jgi:hypothetical protein